MAGLVLTKPEASYRYIVADMLTGRQLRELDLACDSFSQQLNGVGSATCKLALSTAPSDWREVTEERRTTLNILRDGVVVWAGPIMKRQPADNGRTAELSAESWEGYLSRRRIKSALTYTSADVFTIVRGLMASVQTVDSGDVGMTIDDGLAGYVQTIAYDPLARPKLLDEINRLAQISPYFEFYCGVAYDEDTGTFRPHLNLAPAGFNTELPAIVAEYPGNVISYGYPEDGGAAANAVTGIGAGDGVAKLLVEVVDTDGELSRGYPIYEDELSATQETDLSRLTSLTETDLYSRLVDYVVPTCELRGNADPAFSTYPLGIYCWLRVTSPYHPSAGDGSPGLEVQRRVTGWTVKPSASGAQETVTLALSGSFGKVTPPLDAKAFRRWLARVENRLRAQELR